MNCSDDFRLKLNWTNFDECQRIILMIILFDEERSGLFWRMLWWLCECMEYIFWKFFWVMSDGVWFRVDVMIFFGPVGPLLCEIRCCFVFYFMIVESMWMFDLMSVENDGWCVVSLNLWLCFWWWNGVGGWCVVDLKFVYALDVFRSRLVSV